MTEIDKKHDTHEPPASQPRGRPRLGRGGRAELLGFTVTREVKEAFEGGVNDSGRSKSEFFRLLVQTHLMSDGDSGGEVLLGVPRDLAASLRSEAAKRGVSPGFLLAEILRKASGR